MTNKERQENIDSKYSAKKEVRGKAKWCQACSHRMLKGGCRMKKEKATEECLCAKAYNRAQR